MVTLAVVFAANGTGSVWAVVCFYMLLAEVSTREPSGASEKIERLELEVVVHKKNSGTTTSIVAPERLVKCGGNVEAAGWYAAGRRTVQVG